VLDGGTVIVGGDTGAPVAVALGGITGAGGLDVAAGCPGVSVGGTVVTVAVAMVVGGVVGAGGPTQTATATGGSAAPSAACSRMGTT